MYGSAPTLVANFKINCEEMLFFMYLPIKMPYTSYRTPERLKVFQPLIDQVDVDANDYVYLTAKRLYVTPDNMGNRHGWHCDGFGTPDRNYIWTDIHSTEFCVQPFFLNSNCCESMEQMERQAREENIMTFKDGDLLKLTEDQVHRVPVLDYSGMRTFVKISVSKDKYNLVGNSHNYLFNYSWLMTERIEERNHPQCPLHEHTFKVA